MKKLLLVIAIVVGLSGTGWTTEKIALTKALITDMSETYGFFRAQEYSLNQIVKKYPSLSKSTFLARNEFSLSFKSSIERIDSILTKDIKGWSQSKIKILKRLSRMVNINKTTKLEAEQYIETVRQRAKGKIASPIIETLLLFKPGYNKHPEREFLDGYKYKYTSDGSGKAKGVLFSIEIPKTWIAKKGNRPHIVQKFVSENGRGLELFMVQIKEIPSLQDEKITKEDISEFTNSDDVKIFLPKNAVIINRGELTLENLPGFWVSFRSSESRARTVVKSESILYQVFYKNKIIQIITYVVVSTNDKIFNPEGLEKYEKLFDQIANSFIIYNEYQ